MTAEHQPRHLGRHALMKLAHSPVSDRLEGLTITHAVNPALAPTQPDILETPTGKGTSAKVSRMSASYVEFK